MMNSAISRESFPLPGQRGLTLLLADQARPRQLLGVGLGDRPRVPRVGAVVARDDQRRQLERPQVLEAVERPRAGDLAQGVDQRLRVAMELNPFAGDPRHRLAPGRIGLLALDDVGDESLDPAVAESVGEPVPVLEPLLRDLACVDRADHDQAGEPLGMAEGVGDRGVRPHRVAAEDELSVAHRLLDHRLEVDDELRVSITPSRRRRVRLAVTAGVVGDDGATSALQDPRAVDDVAPGRGDPVTEDDRRALAGVLASDRRPIAGRELDRLGGHQPTAARARSMSPTDW